MTDYSDEIVICCAPRWAWEIINETLEMDCMSKAFTCDLREEIKLAYTAMIDACEKGE